MERGFTVIEAVTVIIIIAVMAALLVPLGNSLVNTNRAGQTFDQVQRIYKAIVGDPASGSFGYLGDVGAWPGSMQSLVANPGLTGWNGPYLTDPNYENGSVYDYFGNPINLYFLERVGAVPTDTTSTLFTSPDYLAVLSPGPDHGAAAGIDPSNGAYGTSTGNADNIVFPRFTDSSSLLGYQHLGTVSYSLYNFDSNGNVNTFVPACPMAYTMEVTSIPRGTADQFSFDYAPGAASFELIQGLYNIRVLSKLTSPSSTLFQEKISVVPGGNIIKEFRIPSGLNSTATSLFGFTITNNSGLTITVNTTTGAMSTTTGNGAVRNYNVNGCMPVRISTTAGTLDSFVMPNLALSRTYAASPAYYQLRITNNKAASDYSQVFVYSSGITMGMVTNKGSRRAKDFFKSRGGDTLTFRNLSGAIGSSQPISGDAAIPAP